MDSAGTSLASVHAQYVYTSTVARHSYNTAIAFNTKGMNQSTHTHNVVDSKDVRMYTTYMYMCTVVHDNDWKYMYMHF